jgi:signal transduction histidine kinase
MYPGETEIYFAILLASGILAIVIICFFIVIIRNHRRFLRLQHKQLITEINALEKERKRIVGDLHDELGPLLAAVKLQITTLDTKFKRDIELIDKASGNLDNILSRMRGICNQMLPDVLTRKGLFAAMNEFIEELSSSTSMHIKFTCHLTPVSLQAQLHIYRMMQEMINNAIKHSGAAVIQIDINLNNDKLILEVCDNGKGFNTESVIYNSPGLGVKNIFGRTRMLNGDMYLFSEPGKGTTYKIEIPIACNE